MPDGGEITIERSLEQIQSGIRGIGNESKAIEKDLRAVQSGLRLDPTNVELLNQKLQLQSQQLELSKQRSDELGAAIAELNRINAENGQLTDGQTKLLSTYTQQQKEAEIQVTALTGAIDNQSKAQETAAVTTKTFSQSMTEFQSNLRATQQVMRGVSSAYELLDTRAESSKQKQTELQRSLEDLRLAEKEGKISKEEYEKQSLVLEKQLSAEKRAYEDLSKNGIGMFLKQGQQAVQMMSGIASMGKLLGKSNSDLAKTFSTVAMGVGAAFVAFKLADDLLGQFDGTSRKVAGAVAILAGAVTAGAVAWMAYHGTMSLGVAVPIILAALAVGAAGIKALTKKTNAEVSAATSDISTSVTPTISSSTPSVPSYSGGTTVGSATYISQGGLTEGQMEMASYRGFMRAITESGLNDPKFVGSLDVNGRRFAEVTFNDFLDVNDRRTRGFLTK